MKAIRLGRLTGLEISAMPSAFLGASALWLVLSGIAIGLLNLPLGEALIGALAAAALHWFSDTLHQLGHARAARRTGYPMSGIRYWGILSACVYPPDESALPAATHIRRALGGPSMSAAVTLAAGVILLALNFAQVGGAAWWLALFFFSENLLVFTLGSFLPLNFTDGSTLLHWRNKK
ncbi:MAG: hypothetical protein KGJ80_08600 [Chloroflexota bacterium]|nr:hypothetical protein [Chloroflexota bacterium]